MLKSSGVIRSKNSVGVIYFSIRGSGITDEIFVQGGSGGQLGRGYHRWKKEDLEGFFLSIRSRCPLWISLFEVS